MKIHIKNMVCNRCIMAVKNVFEKSGINPLNVNLGEVETKQKVSESDLNKINQDLNKLGFEIIDDRGSKIIEQIKNVIINKVHYETDHSDMNLSSIIESKIHKDYNYLSNLFSSVEGITIERYYINQKIERVKELLVYDEFNLSEIADRLGYSSVAHLSSQFKKITGLTPTHFRHIGKDRRKPLDKV